MIDLSGSPPPIKMRDPDLALLSVPYMISYKWEGNARYARVEAIHEADALYMFCARMGLAGKLRWPDEMQIIRIEEL
jgi:hypothetical protein